jgi:hypothetical protein
MLARELQCSTLPSTRLTSHHIPCARNTTSLHAMASLLDLPLELILEIVSYVIIPNNNDKPVTLKSLCLTCKFLKNAVQPVLLESIAVSSSHEDQESLKQLLQTITDYPEIATKAKSLSLCLEITANPDREEAGVEVTEAIEPALELIQRLVSISSLHLQGRRFISSRVAQHPGRDLIHLHEASLGSGSPVFSKLQDLRISAPGMPNTEPRSFINIAEYAPFFGHPTLQTLTIEHGLAFDAQNQIEYNLPYDAQALLEWGFSYQPYAVSTITTLRLRECCFTTDTLAQFLGSFSSLKVLEYSSMNRAIPYNDMEWPPGHPIDDPPMPPQDISYAIDICKDTLEELYLDLHPWYGPKDYPIDEGDAYYASRVLDDFMGLQDFTRLKHLDMEAELVPGVEQLSPNLESLVLRHCDVIGNAVVGYFFPYAYNLDNKNYPLLRTVCLEGFWEDDTPIRDLDAAVFDCTGRGEVVGCCFLSHMRGFDVIIRNMARHTDTSDDWRCAS